MAGKAFSIDIFINARDNTEPGVSQATRKVNAFDRANQKTQERLGKMNRTKYQVVLDALDRASGVIGKASDKARSIAGKTFSFTMKAIDMATTPLRAIWNFATSIQGAIFGAVGTWAGLVQPVKLADSITTAQIAFESMLGSAKEAETMMSRIFEFAEKTPFDTTNVISSVQRMMRSGWTKDNVFADMEKIGNVAAAAGQGAEGVERITLALSQMKMSGRLSAEEMLQLTDAGVASWKYLAEGLGVTVEKAREMQEKGLIPIDDAIRHIMSGMNEFDGMMDRMSNRTVTGLLSNIKDTFEIGLVYRWGKGLQEGAIDGLTTLRDYLNEIEPKLKEWGTALQDIGRELSGKLVYALNMVGRKADEVFNSADFKNAETAMDRLKIAWDKIIAEPFSEWWSSTGKAWFHNKATMIGDSVGKGITAGLLTILGIDAASAAGDGVGIGAAFAEGFVQGFDGKKVAEAILSAIGGVISNAGTLFPGGEKADITSWISAGLLTYIGVKGSKGVRSIFETGKDIYSGVSGFFKGSKETRAIERGPKPSASETAMDKSKTGNKGSKATTTVIDHATTSTKGSKETGAVKPKKYQPRSSLTPKLVEQADGKGILSRITKALGIGNVTKAAPWLTKAAPWIARAGGIAGGILGGPVGWGLLAAAIAPSIIDLLRNKDTLTDQPIMTGVPPSKDHAAPAGGGPMDMRGYLNDDVYEPFREHVNRAESWGRNLIGNFMRGRDSVKMDMAGWLNDQVYEPFRSIVNRATSWGRTIMNNFQKGVGSVQIAIPDVHAPNILPANAQKVTPHATGGILTKPHIGLVAEAGPEAIIPLSPSKRNGALDLWQQTGELLGVIPHANGGIFGGIKSALSGAKNFAGKAVSAMGTAAKGAWGAVKGFAVTDKASTAGSYAENIGIGLESSRKGQELATKNIYKDYEKKLKEAHTINEAEKVRTIAHKAKQLNRRYGALTKTLGRIALPLSLFASGVDIIGSDDKKQALIKELGATLGAVGGGALVGASTGALVGAGVISPVTALIGAMIGAGVGAFGGQAAASAIYDRFVPHATGGIMTKPHMGIVAEAGPEAIIPLSPSKRDLGIDLLQKTGELLGVQPYEDGGIAGDIPTASAVPVRAGTSGVTQYIQAKVEKVEVHPEFHIEGDNLDEENVVSIIKARIREMADDIGDELAERLTRIFANMPVKGGV